MISCCSTCSWWHARQANSCALSLEAFQRDRLRQLAVVKSIEIIGEAAGRISDAFRAAHPELPWREIVGMRHRLIHRCFEIDLERVWQTVHQDLPGLVLVLERLTAAADG